MGVLVIDEAVDGDLEVGDGNALGAGVGLESKVGPRAGPAS
jgi:hypothetical protein